MRHILYNTLEAKKIVSIIRGIKKEQIAETVSALLSGGISCIEVAFDHTSPEGINNTTSCLDIISNRFGDKVILGAGTVLSAEEVKIAHSHNAKYIVSPDTNPDVIAATKEKGMLSMPGALTPTEIINAFLYGADIVKVFPVEPFGLSYFKAIRSPLKHIPLAAVGGITADNINLFIENGAVCAGIGSNLVNSDIVEKGQFDKIYIQARNYCSKAEQASEVGNGLYSQCN